VVNRISISELTTNCCKRTPIFQPQTNFSLVDSNPQSALFTFFHFAVVSGGPHRGSQSCKTPRNFPRSLNPLFGVLYVGKNMYLGRLSEETRFPYMVCTRYLCSCSTSWWSFSRPTMHLDDDSCLCLPGLHLWGAKCGENARQIGNEMDSHCWHFLGLKSVNLRSNWAQKRLSSCAWGHIYKWRQLMHHGHMHRVFKFSSMRQPRSTNFSSSCPDSPNGSGSIEFHARPCKP